MAFETAAASDMADLVSKLFTFATANGWTQDDLDTPNGEAAMHNTGGRCFVSFRWNTTTPLNLAIYQALGFGPGLSTAVVAAGGTGYTVGDVLTLVGGTFTTAATVTVLTAPGGVVGTVAITSAGINYTSTPGNPVSTTGGTGTGCTLTCTFTGTNTTPGNNCDDSGQGFVTSTDGVDASSSLDKTRALPRIGDGPYTYWFFSDTSPDYIHIVVESSPGIYRHASFGVLNKKGDWLGGEYCCGQAQLNTSVLSTVNLASLDGLWFNTSTSGASNQTENRGPTVHMEKVYSQAAAGKWGAVFNSTATGSTTPSVKTDRAGNARQRMLGGFKGNMIAPSFGWIASAASNGFVPMYGIAVWYFDIAPNPDELSLVGFLPDARGVNIKGFAPAQEVPVGSETWIVFPVSRKANAGAADDTRNMGLAYKKVV